MASSFGNNILSGCNLKFYTPENDLIYRAFPLNNLSIAPFAQALEFF
jgi:hypothetical protein